MDIALGKFFLDVVKQLGDVFMKNQDSQQNLVAVGTFLELYGSSMRLHGYAQKVRTSQENEDDAELIREAFCAFFEEVRHFGQTLRKANLDAIDVFHPQLAAELARVIEMDANLQCTFEHEIAPRYKLKKGPLKEVVDLYVTHYRVSDGGGWREEYWRPDYLGATCHWQDWMPEAFEELAVQLATFSVVIGDVIRQTWAFKELATIPPSKR